MPKDPKLSSSDDLKIPGRSQNILIDFIRSKWSQKNPIDPKLFKQSQAIPKDLNDFEIVSNPKRLKKDSKRSQKSQKIPKDPKDPNPY